MVLDITKVDETVARVSRLLHEGKLKVRFIKKDGTKRTMLCTKKQDLIPESQRPKPQPTIDEQGNAIPPKPARVMPPQLVTVFDLEKQEWRSFNIINVFNLEVVHD